VYVLKELYWILSIELRQKLILKNFKMKYIGNSGITDMTEGKDNIIDSDS